MRVALLSYNAKAADAIGNTLAEKLAFFVERGADARVFVEDDRQLHPAVNPHCRAMLAQTPNDDDWRFLASADLVVVEYSQDYRLLELLPLLGHGKGRILFDYHGVTPPELWHAQNREAIEGGMRKRGLVWCADAVLAHSRSAARELGPCGFPAERSHRLAHPVDCEFFQPGEAAQPLGKQLGLAEASILLFVGRLAPNKRLGTLVEALARLQDMMPPVHAVVIGDDGDIYQTEAAGCRHAAAHLGVADRIHFLGRVKDRQLLDAYRSANVFVMPSRHEGFCIPVLEAMACGLPVIAARATALPETVGSAGLTFIPDDADDLARQVRRVLGNHTSSATARHGSVARVAIVSFRYGTDFVGGAEASLRTIAETLGAEGHAIEVFTTCTRAEHAWTNELPPGSTDVNGIRVHRFPIDAHDPLRHREAVRAILEGEGPVAAETEKEYLEHSIHSGALIERLRVRQDDFDAIIVGPYLFGLTLDVARSFPEKTLVLPCFHDEPLARLGAWLEYERAGSILYHSPDEQALAEAQLGVNHPGAVCIGALVDAATQGDPQAGQRHVGCAGPYIVYCGRYSAQKGLPALVERAHRYLEQYPGRFTFVFLGQGEVAIPKQAGFVNLGFVAQTVKRDVLAGAAALALLSRHESLSYVALEAWAQGTPVIADHNCAVLVGHIERSGGGRTVTSFEDFGAALDDLFAHAESWRQLGRQGQEYVRAHYGSRAELARKLRSAIGGLTAPIAERMRARGLERAALLSRARWRERFGDLVEHVLDAGPRPFHEAIEVKPRSPRREAAVGSGTVFVPVRVVNRGSHALLADGPGRHVLRCHLTDSEGEVVALPRPETPLPGLLIPGRALSAALAIAVPPVHGTYSVTVEVVAADRPSWAKPGASAREEKNGVPRQEATFSLVVNPGPAENGETCCGPLLEAAQSALAEAGARQRLPDDYYDVTEGLLASWKRRVKRKLLGNFKHAYVDVLSRQQSAFNERILAALHELTECCATLDHARRQRGAGSASAHERDLARQLEESRKRCAGLEERLARLEEVVSGQWSVVSGQPRSSDQQSAISQPARML